MALYRHRTTRNQLLWKLLTLTYLTEMIKSMNMLTSFPPKLTLSKFDKVGFRMSNFINGSQLIPQVFPKPYLKMDKYDTIIKISHEFDDCFKATPNRDLEIMTICKKNGEEYFSVIQYNPKNGLPFYRYDDFQSLKGKKCIDIHGIRDTFWVTCVKKSGTYYDLQIIGFKLKRSIDDKGIEKTEMIKIDELTYSAFYSGEEKNNFSKLKIKCTEDTSNSEIDLRCLSFLTEEANFGKVLWIEYIKKENKIVFTQPISQAFPEGVVRVRFADNDWIIYEKIGKSILIPCNLKSRTINCDETKGYNFDGENTSKWDFKRNFASVKTSNTYSSLFFLSGESVEVCKVNKIPWPQEKSKLDCQVTSLMMNLEMMKGLVTSYVYITPSHSVMLTSVYKKPEPGKKIIFEGYFYIDMNSQLTKFINITDFQSEGILFLNTTYYYSITSERVNLVRRGRDDVIISTPEQTKSQKVMVSASPGILSKEFGKTKSFILETNLYTINTIGDYLEWDGLHEISVYNKGWFDMGFNSRVIEGNLASIKVEIEDLELPSKQTITRETETVALGDSIDDVDLKKVFLFSGFGNTHEQIIDDEGKFKKDVDFENIFLAFMNFKNEVRVLECQVMLTEWAEDDDGANDFRMGLGLNGLQREIDKKILKDLWMKGKNTCKLVYNFTLNNGILEGGECDGQNLFLKTSNIVIDEKTRENREEMRLIRISKNFQKTGEAIISPYKSRCDIQLFGSYLYSICTFSRKTGKLVADKGEYPINGIILRQFESLSETFKMSQDSLLNPAEQGSPLFRMGATLFIAGTEKKALVINNHKEDPSLLLIDFSGINKGIESYISEKVTLRSEITQTGSGVPLDIKICPTLSTIFLFSKEASKIYGINLNSLKESYITVPLNEREGQEREIKDMMCSNSDESFQLWIRDKFTQKNLILSYFGYSGLRGTKKLHSEFELSGKVDEVAMTNLLKTRDGLLFTFAFEKSSIFYNHSYVTDLRGPMVSFNTNNLNKGTYEVKVEVKNPGVTKKSTFTLNSEVPRDIKILNKPEPNYPDKYTNGREVKFSDIVDIQGDVFDIEIADSDKKSLNGIIEIIKPLEMINDKNSYKIQNGEKFLNSKAGFVMMSKGPQINLYKDWANLWSTITVTDYGQNCKEYDLAETTNNYVVTFICTVDLEETIFVTKISKTAPKDTKFTLVSKFIIHFEVKMVKIINQGPAIIITIVEKIGSKVTVWRVNLESDKETPQNINFNWRRPGNNNLFSFCKFYMVNLKEKVALIILIPGKNTFDIMTLDFKIKSVQAIIEVKTKNNAPFYFLRCGRGNDEVFLKSEGAKESINCIGGGVGIYFHEFEVEILQETGITFTKDINKYRFPQLKQYNVLLIDAHGEYFLVKGDFGDYTITRKKLENGKSVDVVKRLTGILFKRGTEQAVGYPPYGNKVVDLEKYKEENVLISIHDVEDKEGEEKICVQKIYDKGYKVRILNGVKLVSEYHYTKKIDYVAIHVGKDYPENQLIFEMKLGNVINIGTVFYVAAIILVISFIIYLIYFTRGLLLEKKLNQAKREAFVNNFIASHSKGGNEANQKNPIKIFGGDSYQTVAENDEDDFENTLL